VRLLTCLEVIDCLGAYVDEELPPDLRGRFDEHVAVCSACVDYIETYRQTQALTRRAAEDEARANDDDEVPEPLVQAILAAWSERDGDPPG
jgi:anti-sigma factor RsiW